MTITIRGTEIQLLPQRAIYLPKYELLVIADMHLGKLVHFRKKGLFVPTSEWNEDLEILQLLIRKYQPKEVLFLGDLFHSEINSEYDDFLNSITEYPNVKFTLTKGNHDIIPPEYFQKAQVEIIEEKILANNIVLRHQLPKRTQEDIFYIIGHIHPGYIFQGRGRQFYRLPCFHQSENMLTLPAFGKHTGLFIPEFMLEDSKYVIINEEVIQMK